ncbi:MAG: GNAT family N-acetyltransferase [Candidatus Babeliales bacterium]
MKQLLFSFFISSFFMPAVMSMDVQYKVISKDPARASAIVAYTAQEYTAQENEVGKIYYAIDAGKITWIWVDEYMCNKGIGSQLFRRAIEDMQSVPRVTWYSLDTAVEFYLKLGAQIDKYSSFGGAYMSIDPKRVVAQKNE